MNKYIITCPVFCQINHHKLLFDDYSKWAVNGCSKYQTEAKVELLHSRSASRRLLLPLVTRDDERLHCSSDPRRIRPLFKSWKVERRCLRFDAQRKSLPELQTSNAQYLFTVNHFKNLIQCTTSYWWEGQQEELINGVALASQWTGIDKVQQAIRAFHELPHGSVHRACAT